MIGCDRFYIDRSHQQIMDEDGTLDCIEAIERDKKYFIENLNVFRKKYKRFVAISDQEVINHHRNRSKLLDKLKAKYGNISFYLGDLNDPDYDNYRELVIRY